MSAETDKYKINITYGENIVVDYVDKSTLVKYRGIITRDECENTYLLDYDKLIIMLKWCVENGNVFKSFCIGPKCIHFIYRHILEIRVRVRVNNHIENILPKNGWQTITIGTVNDCDYTIYINFEKSFDLTIEYDPSYTDKLKSETKISENNISVHIKIPDKTKLCFNNNLLELNCHTLTCDANTLPIIKNIVPQSIKVLHINPGKHNGADYLLESLSQLSLPNIEHININFVTTYNIDKLLQYETLTRLTTAKYSTIASSKKTSKKISVDYI